MTSNRRELSEYAELPYTVISQSSLPKEFHLFLTGDGLKEIVKRMRPGEDLSITVFSDNNRAKFEIVDTHEKYSKRGTE